MDADEISTGLDSATTRDVVKLLKIFAEKFNAVGVVSLLQPPPEVFALFDRVMLMREGCIVYHGACWRLVLLFHSCHSMSLITHI